MKHGAIQGAILAVILVAACSEHGQTPIDAMPDTPPDVTMPLPTAFHHFVVANQQLPQNNNEARALGLDLNGDQVVDNQFGMVLGTLSGQGLTIDADMSRAIDRGNVIELVEAGFDGATGVATFTLFRGTNPSPPACSGAGDTVCRHHLDGGATFDVAATPRDEPLVGDIAGGRLVTPIASGAHLSVFISMGGPPFELPMIGARVQIASATDLMLSSGVIAGAITQSDVDAKLIPGMQTEFAATVARDCNNLGQPPNCGCGNGTSGKSLIGLFDTNPADCTISVAEVRNNSLIMSLLAPDVDIDGQQALSFGVGFDAVTATFAP